MSVHGTSWALYSAQPWERALPQPWEAQPVTPYEPQPRYLDELAVEPWQYDLPLPPGQVPLGTPGFEPALRTPTADAASAPTVEQLDSGDHVAHGARSMVVPGLLGGMVGGAFAAGAAHASRGAVFASHAAKGVVGGVATGAAMGLLVAASSPDDGDDLGARYAVAGGAIGVTAGLVSSRGAGAGLNTAVAAGTNAVLGWFIGNRLEQRA